MGRLRLIGAIFAKDLRLLSRDRFSMLMTVLGLVFYVLIFWLMPSAVDETVTIGVYQQDLGSTLGRFLTQEQPGLRIVSFDSVAELQAGVRGDGPTDVQFGLAFPPTFLSDMAAGRPVEVRPQNPPPPLSSSSSISSMNAGANSCRWASQNFRRSAERRTSRQV